VLVIGLKKKKRSLRIRVQTVKKGVEMLKRKSVYRSVPLSYEMGTLLRSINSKIKRLNCIN
jgi:hypothetical protein